LPVKGNGRILKALERTRLRRVVDYTGARDTRKGVLRDG
jgi:hypothetical protein